MPTTFIGKYRIEGVLGHGGMGVVYAGWDSDLERKVAIKVLGDAAIDSGRARLLREARAMAKLSHPNVITVFEVDSHDGRDFIVMELVDGRNLAEWLRDPHDRAEILRLFVEAGRGLASAHAAGMIHRDFKPHNVLVRRDGRPLVTDFGLVRLELAAATPKQPLADSDVAALVNAVAHAGEPAVSVPTVRLGDPGSAPTLDERVLGNADALSPTLVDRRSDPDTLTQAGAVLGTPGYMAPEQYAGIADARSDQFAYCVALWEGLTGALPFPGATVEARLAAIELGPQLRVGANVSGRLHKVIARGLDADPRKRWPSIDALLRALQPTRRRAWWIAAVAAIAIVVLGIAVVALLEREPPRVAPAIVVKPPASPPELFSTGKLHHLTIADGCEESPSFTPDGKEVVFDGLAGKNYMLYAVDVATGKPRRLTTTTTGWEFKAAISPDGRRVAFIRKEERGDSAYVMGLDGRNAKLLGVSGLQPIWAPDGKAVWIGHDDTTTLVSIENGKVLRTLDSIEHERAQEGVVLPNGDMAFLMFPAQGAQTAEGVAVYDSAGKSRWLVKQMFLEAIAVAPDREALLVGHMTDAGTRDLMRVPLDGSRPTVVPGPAQPTYGIAVSTRGDRIVWSDCMGKTALEMLAIDTMTVTPLPTGSWADLAPAVVPGTQQMVIASDRGEHLALWVIDLEHEDSTRELPGVPNSESATAAVSIDGKWVYAVDNENVLTMQPFDGSQPPRRLAEHVSGTPAPRRDGSVVVTIGRSAGRYLGVVPAGGGKPVTLVPDASTPCASPVSDELYFVALDKRHEGTVMHRDAAGKIRPLSAELGVSPWETLVVSGDGKRIALVEQTRITVVDTATGHIVGRYDARVGTFSGATWVGNGIVVSHSEYQGDLFLFDRSEQ